jgi:hypothetical protein
MVSSSHFVECDVCKEHLGDYKPYYAKKHLKMHPDHRSYSIRVKVKNSTLTIRNPRTKHIKHIRFKGDHNNNKMERMNGEIRDREKTMRGLKKVDKPQKGWQIKRRVDSTQNHIIF